MTGIAHRQKYLHTVFAFLLCIASGYAETDPDVMEELKLIAMHNRAAYDKVQNFKAKGKIQFREELQPHELPFGSQKHAGVTETEIDCVWRRNGQTYFVERKSLITHVEIGLSESAYHASTLNNSYYAEISFGIPNQILLYPHQSIKEIPQYISDHVAESWQNDPRLFGFTTGWGKFLIDQLPLHPDVIRWTLAKSSIDDGILYVIEYVNPLIKGTTEKRVRYEIDPQRGYLITSMRHWNGNGQLETSIDVDAREIAPGIWFPIDAKKTTPSVTYSLHLDSVEVDPRFDEKDFAFDSFVFDRSNTMLKRVEDGGRSVTWLRFHDGHWIPASLFSASPARPN